MRGGELLLELAAGRVPYRTGRLARSARLKADERGVAIGYSRWTARVLHARAGDWHFGAGRSGRWLEETIDAHAESVGRVIAEAFKSGWPGLTPAQRRGAHHGHDQDPGPRLHDRDRHRVPGHARLDPIGGLNLLTPSPSTNRADTTDFDSNGAPSTSSWSAALSSRSRATTSKTPSPATGTRARPRSKRSPGRSASPRSARSG